MSTSEYSTANAFVPRWAFNMGVTGIWIAYFLRRNSQTSKLLNFRVDLEMMFAVSWRSIVAVLVADRISNRLFKNKEALLRQRMARNELRKTMRTVPNARPYVLPHQRPNSYFWV
jgi:hypothetical protein